MKKRLAIDGRVFELDDQQFESLATGAFSPSPLPSFERRILWRCCENGISHSATSIAAEEWQGWEDPITTQTVTLALVLLNDQGLVTYRESGQSDELNQFVHIKPTGKGYEAAGFPPPFAIVQSMGIRRNYRQDAPRRPGDMTDFRNLYDITIGGPIERDTLENHLLKYPDHITIHPAKEELMSKQDITNAANGFRIPPHDLVNLTVDQLMDKTGLSKARAYELRKEATAEVHGAGASEPLKFQIIELLTREGVQAEIESIRRKLDGHWAPMDITRAVWALQKQGEVTFYERKRGKDSLLTRIKLSRGVKHNPKPAEHKRRHPVGRDMTDAKHHGAHANGGPIERVIARPTEFTPRYSTPGPLPQNMKPVIDEAPVETPRMEAQSMGREAHDKALEPDTHTQYPNAAAMADELMHNYPLIAALVAKQGQLAAYEKAAKALEEVDPELAVAMLEKVRLTDLEKEVISFVQRQVDGD